MDRGGTYTYVPNMKNIFVRQQTHYALAITKRISNGIFTLVCVAEALNEFLNTKFFCTVLYILYGNNLVLLMIKVRFSPLGNS